jgi:NAD-dependent dihydropyrimidine dehydrogenase PreA subunit
MPNVQIEDQGCRGCTMCVDICPVDVFAFDEDAFLAKVERQNDCIGCLSCVYVCPSRCVEVSDVPMMRPFHRIEKNATLIKKFLQSQTVEEAVSVEDWQEAGRDVAARLSALGAAVTETMGRG